MTTITETGANGLDGEGTWLWGGDANPQLPWGADATDGEAITMNQVGVVLDAYYDFSAHGGRGGYGGFGEDPVSWPSADYVPGAGGSDGGDGGAGGDATSVVDSVTTAFSVRATAWAGRGGHGGEGGTGSSNSAGLAVGGNAGSGGNGGNGGNATARVVNIAQTFNSFGYYEIVAHAAAGIGGVGGQAGYGGNGNGPGGPGLAGLAGVGGNAVAEISGNRIVLTEGNVGLSVHASAGHGGPGGGGAFGGNWIEYHPNYQPEMTPGEVGGAAGHGEAILSGNVVTAGDLANEVHLTAMVSQAVGGTGGMHNGTSTRAADGADGTGTMSIVGNTVSLGGGDDRLVITLSAFQGTTVQFSGNSFDGGAGSDTLEISASFIGEDGQTVGAIALDLANGFAGFENVLGSWESDYLIAAAGGSRIDGGNGDDRLIGRQGADIFLGGYGNDTLSTGNGNDQLNGGGGDDHLSGGHGNDLIDGGEGTDTASYALVAAGVTVSLSVGTYQNTGGGGSDRLVGIENLVGSKWDDILTGSSGANIIDGGAGRDILYGRVGNDQLLGGGGNDDLVGGLGTDTLTGGSGGDRFVFRSLSESGVGAQADRITDFVSGTDTIDVSAIDAVAGGLDDAFRFIGTAALGGTGTAEARYRYDGNGHTIIAFDMNGDATVDFAVWLDGEIALTSGDFIL